MNSREKNARIVCRMKSVDVTRVIPSRCAASVASVDLPVPVAPPTSRSDRELEVRSACRRRSRRIVRPASGSPRTSPAMSASRSRSSSRAPRSCMSGRRGGELVRSRRRQPGRGKRARHQPLRPRRPFVASERQRCEVAPLAHTPTAAAEIASAASRSSERRGRARPEAARRRSPARTTGIPRAGARARRRRRSRRP